MSKLKIAKKVVKKVKEKIRPPLTAAQNRARIAKIQKKEKPARDRQYRIKMNKETREMDESYDKANRPLTGGDKFKAKNFGISTKGKENIEVRQAIDKAVGQKKVDAGEAVFIDASDFLKKISKVKTRKKSGGSVKKKKVVKLKVGGALSDYYKGMM